MEQSALDDGLRMIEFFSGIGGMRLAVEAALQKHDDKGGAVTRNHERRLSSCRAYDISLHANRTYAHNFEETALTKLVEQLKVSDLDGKADLWTMSPPCQPFTKTQGAKSLDMEDKRCHGLKGIMKLLTGMTQKPRWILLENVKGFPTSQMCQAWKECLKSNGYSWQEYLLSPIQLGIPNHRLRYYILCELHSTRWSNTDDEQGRGELLVEEPPAHWGTYNAKVVGEYVDISLLSLDELQPYLVTDAILNKQWARHLGIVGTGDTATHCFTAGYSRIFSKATGSLLLFRGKGGEELSVYYQTTTVADEPIDRSDMLQYSGRLRRFTPVELLALFGFRPSFAFPPEINLEHQYKLIGNSINANVVTALVKELLLLSAEGESPIPVSSSLQRTTTTSGTGRMKTTTRNSSSLSSLVESSSSQKDGKLTIGGIKGHIEEEIEGNLLRLYQAFRWKPLPNCTGRHTCREHTIVSPLPPLELLAQVGITHYLLPSISSSSDLEEAAYSNPNNYADAPGASSALVMHTFELPGRPDRVLVVPLDSENYTGVISFEKKNERQDDNGDGSTRTATTTTTTTMMTGTHCYYVHTLNSPSGFRRKLNAIGIRNVTDSIIQV